VALFEMTLENDGESLTCRQGDEIAISLDENPTTGFRWAFDALDAAILELIDAEFEGREPIVPGRGGERHFLLRVLQAGSTDLQLKEWREWEGDESVIRRFSLALVVV